MSNRQSNGSILTQLNLFFFLPCKYKKKLTKKWAATQLLWHHRIHEFMFTLSRCTTALHDNTLPVKQMAFTFPLGGCQVWVSIHLASFPPEVMGGPDLEPPCQPISESGEHCMGALTVLPLTNTGLESAQTIPEHCPSCTHTYTQSVKTKLGHWFYNDASSQGGIGSWLSTAPGVWRGFLDTSPAGYWDSSDGEARLQTCAAGESGACRTWRGNRAQLYSSKHPEPNIPPQHT